MKSVKAYRSKLSKIQFSDGQAQLVLQEIKDAVGPVPCTRTLLDSCEIGMAELLKPSSTQNQLPMQLADLFNYRRTRDGDGGERLSAVFQQELKHIDRVARDTKWAVSRSKFEATTLDENARIVLRADKNKTPVLVEQCQEKRSLAFNMIMNAVYRSKGADAWVFSAALHAKGSLHGNIAKLSNKDYERFKSEAVKSLKQCKFEKMPDTTPIFHFPAWLAWLLEVP